MLVTVHNPERIGSPAVIASKYSAILSCGLDLDTSVVLRGAGSSLA